MRTVDHHPRAAREGGPVFVGIDSHKDTLAACVVDVSGREVRSAAFENSPAGHLDLLRWARQAGDLERFGIEGSANLAAGLARRLMAEGEAVFEVPCEMTVRERRRLRRPGKSDPADALAIARVTAREHTLPPARQAGVAEDLKVLSDYRDQLVVERNAEVNRLHADLAIVRPGYARHCRSLVAARALVTANRLLRGDASRRGHVARRRIGRLRQLDRQIAELGEEIAGLVRDSRTGLTDIVGIGPLLAARILGEVGEVSRYPSADHFASANGTAPIPASSGRTDRHRLNRGGNRRLNKALHYMALTQANFEPRAIAYLARKQSEGKTRREALRCLKRRLSDVVYKTLVAEAREERVAA
jgi:transposase